MPTDSSGRTRTLGELITNHEVRGNLVTDAQLAALAIEHGVTLHSNDTDFARFPQLRWTNPLS
ncbi:MAG: PIN domain-containing protein [Solirubrobacterales bacterium]